MGPPAKARWIIGGAIATSVAIASVVVVVTGRPGSSPLNRPLGRAAVVGPPGHHIAAAPLAAPSGPPPSQEPPPPSGAVAPPEPPTLVPWAGPVEHLFFHTLVIQPELAFTRDRLGKGFRDYFVTKGEFRTMLDQLDANGWTLVDIHRVVAGTVRVPPGRRPFVLSEDDVNYYEYEHLRGLGWRLVLDATGAVKVESSDQHGGTRISDDDLIPIVDEFVAAHPEFSADGAKGVLAVTGYEGVFGERVQNLSLPDHDAAVARASAVATALKADGWIIASHSYGHIDLAKDSTAIAQRDTSEWKATIEPIVGVTDIYIYPFGSRPRAATLQMLRANGFSIFCDIDVAPKLVRSDSFAVMSRRHIDGIALSQQARALLPFFDAAVVEDRPARGLGPAPAR